jgi:hypothetical protein
MTMKMKTVKETHKLNQEGGEEKAVRRRKKV